MRLTLIGSHFDATEVNFGEVAQGFPSVYTAAELDQIRADTRKPAEDFANLLSPDTDAQGNPVAPAADA